MVGRGVACFFCGDVILGFVVVLMRFGDALRRFCDYDVVGFLVCWSAFFLEPVYVSGDFDSSVVEAHDEAILVSSDSKEVARECLVIELSS